MKTHQLCILTILLATALCIPAACAANAISFSPAAGTIHLDETVDLVIMMDSVPDGLVGYDIDVNVVNPGIAEITAVQFPAWAVIYENTALPASSVNLRAVDGLSGVEPNATGVVLATVTVRGLQSGTTPITVIPKQIEDENADPIPVTTTPASVEVIPPTLSFVPQSATIGVDAVTTIDFMLDEAPFGLTGYNITVAVSNPSVAGITLVSFPAWATVCENSTLPASSVQMVAADLNNEVDEGATDVLLGTITVKGLSAGTSALTFSVEQIDDERPLLITPIITDGTLTVTSGSGSGRDARPAGTETPTPTPTEPSQTEFTTTGQLTLRDDGTVDALTEIWDSGKNAYLLIEEGVLPLNSTGSVLDNLSLAAIPADAVPPAGAGSVFSFAGYAFECSPSGAVFDPAIIITFVLSEEEWDAIGTDELVIEWYNEETGAWETLPTKVDTITRTVCAEVTHFTVFALFAQNGAEPTVAATPATTAAPATQAPTSVVAAETAVPASAALVQPDGGIPWFWIIGAVIIILLVAGAHWLLEWEKKFDAEHTFDQDEKKK